jgi:hypothetical protein
MIVIILLFIGLVTLWLTGLYNVRGAWRSVNEPAFFGGAGSGETDQHFLFLQIN